VLNCNYLFLISHGGRSDIDTHLKPKNTNLFIISCDTPL